MYNQIWKISAFCDLFFFFIFHPLLLNKRNSAKLQNGWRISIFFSCCIWQKSYLISFFWVRRLASMKQSHSHCVTSVLWQPLSLAQAVCELQMLKGALGEGMSSLWKLTSSKPLPASSQLDYYFLIWFPTLHVFYGVSNVPKRTSANGSNLEGK